MLALRVRDRKDKRRKDRFKLQRKKKNPSEADDKTKILNFADNFQNYWDAFGGWEECYPKISSGINSWKRVA